MNRMMGVALALLALAGAALALWAPAGAIKDRVPSAELTTLTAARDAAEKALAAARVDTEKAAAALTEARAEGERKLAAAKTESERALGVLRRESEGLVAAIKADADKAVAAAKADTDRAVAAAKAEASGEQLATLRAASEKQVAGLREELNQCQQAAAAKKPGGDLARCAAGTTAPPTGPVAAADIARELGDSGSIALYGIQFDTGKAKLTDESRASLDEVAKAMKDDLKLKLMVVGHTDSKGDFNTNRQISEQRAQAVVTDLVSRGGVEPARLSSAGVADLAPVSTNDTDAGRARNRRVEFVKR
ncbi:MAG TPA: OmpA family protein [Vineibacter sp.]|nr:OmpA family protein [Vineibacter sp.]